MEIAKIEGREIVIRIPIATLPLAFSMLDVAIAPLLWRLEHYEIDLPKSAAPLFKYAERIFSRQGFIDSMTPQEKIMRK